MDFLQELRSHRGGLLLLKTQLYWYGGRGWDGIRGRVCLLLNADAARTPAAGTAAASRYASPARIGVTAPIELLVDGAPHWIWVAQEDVELLS
jgi:hypothetical protein